MKRYFLLAFAGLVFGLISGCVSMEIYHHDEAMFDGMSDPDAGHWYDWILFSSAPGLVLNRQVFNPPDGYSGDVWDNRIHIIFLNGLGWMLIVVIFSFLALRIRNLWIKPAAADPSTTPSASLRARLAAATGEG